MAWKIEPTEDELKRAVEESAHSFIEIPNPGGGAPVPLTIVCRANTDVSHREANVAVNIARPLPRFTNRPDLQIRRYEPIALVGGGPSVSKHLDEIRKFKWIMAAGSSHDFLVDNGIIPTFALSTDSKEETQDYYRKPQRDCTYLFASTCPPSLFDRMENYNVQLWHFHDQVDHKHYRGEKAVGWGCMVGIVGISMALWLGFQEQHYFGYDCCFDEKTTHAYEVSQAERDELAESTIAAEQGDEKIKFLTTTALIAQITHFYGVYRGPDGRYLKGYVYGPGMLWDSIRQSPPEMRQWLEAV